MRLGLSKYGSVWLLTALTAAVVVSLAVFVDCIPLVSQIWDVVDGCSYRGEGGTFGCFGEGVSCEFFGYWF
jgi:hypothetical protein